MKANVIIVLVLLVTAAVIPFIAVSAEFDDPNNENYEFYFTRLRYRENGMRGRGFLGMGGTMPKPARYRCPEFGGGNFFPPQGWGWGTDYPGGDCKFMGGIHRLTGLPVYPHSNVGEILDRQTLH